MPEVLFDFVVLPVIKIAGQHSAPPESADSPSSPTAADSD